MAATSLSRHRPARGERGQGLTEFLGLVLVVAVCLALGASLIPSSDLPELARDGYRKAVCTTTNVAACEDQDQNEDEDVTASSNDDESTDPPTDQPAEDDGGDDDEGDDGGDDDGGVFGGVKDFVGGAKDAVSDGIDGAWKGTKQVGGFFKGAGEQAGDTFSGITDSLANPVDAFNGFVELVKDPGTNLPILWDEATKPIRDDWNKGNYGEAIGRGSFAAIEVVFGGKGLSKLGKTGRIDHRDDDSDDDDTSDDDSDDGETTACPRSWGGGTAGEGAHIQPFEDADCTVRGEGSLSQDAKSTLDHIDSHNGQPPQGYRKHSYANDPDSYAKPGQPKAQKLPDTDQDGNPITYTTYYTKPKVKGQDPGGERLVYGSDGTVWYTTNHYTDMTRVR